MPEGFRTATLYQCGTFDMSADIFTKSLAGNLFFYHADAITGKRKRSSEEAIERGSKKSGGVPTSKCGPKWSKR